MLLSVILPLNCNLNRVFLTVFAKNDGKIADFYENITFIIQIVYNFAEDF